MPIDWSAPVFQYCERQAAGLAGEPLNALSNAAFLAAAGWAWRRAPASRHDLRRLAGLLGLVGLASLAFHTMATRLTGMLDVLAILLFNLAFLASVLRGPLAWPWPPAVAGLLAFLLLGPLLQDLPGASALHGSAAYLAPWLTLLLLILALRTHAPAAAARLAAAAGVFAVSLTLRTLDQPLCSVWPAGLHWAWHLLNALVLFLLIGGLAQAGECSGQGFSPAGGAASRSAGPPA